MSNLTKAQLIEALSNLQIQMDHINKREGCPTSFMPVYKLTQEIAVSENLINFAIEQNEDIKCRVYSTASGGHIINCKGYPVKKVKNAVGAIVQRSEFIGKNLIRHKSSGRVFGVGSMAEFVGQKL